MASEEGRESGPQGDDTLFAGVSPTTSLSSWEELADEMWEHLDELLG